MIPFCPAEHHSCWRDKTLDLSEAKPSFQRPVNSEKRKVAFKAGTVGCPFLAPSFGQTKEGGETYCSRIRFNNSSTEILLLISVSASKLFAKSLFS
jgi:hypothetical protein